jgi:hypothetical protein
MSHWYDFPPMKRQLKQIKETMGYRYVHKGESLSVFDSKGIVVRLSALDRGMDFARTVNSVLETKHVREIEAAIS